MSINDIIQEGNLNLTKAIRRIDWARVTGDDDDKIKTLKSFLSKRIKGGIRRAVDKNRGDIRIPEHKLNEIRKTMEAKTIRWLLCFLIVCFYLLTKNLKMMKSL